MTQIAPLALEAAAKDACRPVEYVEFSAATRAPPPPPAFIFGNLPAYLSRDLFGDFEVPAAGCYILRDAQVTYDAIILLQGQPLWSPALNHPHYYVPEVLARHVPNAARLPMRRIEGRAAIIHGPGYKVFGHWLIDFLPRLYILRRAGFDIATLTFIVPSDLHRFAREFLRLVGIPAAHLVAQDHRAELVQPDELIAPTMLRLRNRFNPLLAVASRFWLNRMELPGTPHTGRRIFVSRSQSHGNRMLTSRDAIEARAVRAGYEIVFPERLSLPEQIALFRGAGRIIGEYGSGLHGAMHAPPGAVICALRGTSHHPGFAQSGLAERFGHHLGYVFGDTPEFAEDQCMDITSDAFDKAVAATEAWGWSA
jgi:hypothetical protein